MQTFLPYADFNKSAKALDRTRLGNQRLEVLALLQAIAGEKKGWRNHPAAKMWEGYENALVIYGIAICEEWIHRGYKDTRLPLIESYYDPKKPLLMPPWMGQRSFHKAHKSNLIRKKPEHYGPLFPNVPDDLEYVWPVKKKSA